MFRCMTARSDVTLFPFDRQIDPQGEEQASLEWQQRTVIDAHGISRSFFYADLQSIRLNKVDGRNARPLYSSKLCQIQYKLQVQVKRLVIALPFSSIDAFQLDSFARHHRRFDLTHTSVWIVFTCAVLSRISGESFSLRIRKFVAQCKPFSRLFSRLSHV